VTDDPVLTAIAAGTNDVLTDRLWRYDTGTADPVADLAATLHSAAEEFTITTGQLERTMQRLARECAHQRLNLTSYAAVLRPHGLDRDALNLVQQLERHDLNREILLTAYRAWRQHRPTSRDPKTRHLLPAPYNPTSGQLTLTTEDHDGWLVTPDPAAATSYHAAGLSGQVIGQITPTHQGWKPTAFTLHHHQGQTIRQHTHPLPPVDDEAAACRSLLRWWAHYTQPTWDGRTPAQLTTAEHNALSA
jgi:hypothetical protein